MCRDHSAGELFKALLKNALPVCTCRAQSRVSVSQALERIRKVASERKKEKFTALFHHLSTDLLEDAFFELEEGAAPGVDRLSWKDYEAHRAVEI
jgi:RNA-directed DNA polymerase